MSRLLLLVPLVALTACQSTPPRYDFVVASERNGQPMALYATDIDTTYWELLVPGEDTPYGPAWSPDGETIAYTATADSVRTVFFLRDGQITSPVERGANGASVGGFSPDGTQFLYAKRTSQGTGHIMRLDIASGQSTQLTFTEDYNTTPVFTPDGGSMVHCRQHTETVGGEEVRNGDIFLTDLTTGGVIRLTTSPSFDCLAQVSPLGDAVAYHSCGEPGCRIRLVALDGTDDRLLADVEGSWPRWSPDGKWIAFTGTVDGNSDIWLIRPDGSGLRAMTTTSGRDETADWRPFPG